jgi:hypothetical protein
VCVCVCARRHIYKWFLNAVITSADIGREAKSQSLAKMPSRLKTRYIVTIVKKNVSGKKARHSYSSTLGNTQPPRARGCFALVLKDVIPHLRAVHISLPHIYIYAQPTHINFMTSLQFWRPHVRIAAFLNIHECTRYFQLRLMDNTEREMVRILIEFAS